MPELLQIAGLALKISIMVQVFAAGLGCSWADATYLFHRPKLLLNSILARNIAVPILAVLLIKAFSIQGAVAIAILVLAVTPVPPLLPSAQMKAGGRTEYVFGLLVSQTVLAVAIVPLTIAAMERAFGSETHFSASQVATLMIQSILLPLGLGMLAARMISSLHQYSKPLVTIANILLLLGVIPLLAIAWKAFGALAGNGTMLALVILALASTAIGHFLGGPNPEDRTTLALATSARHPAVAIAIAKENFPEQFMLVAGAVLIYLILRTILSIPYTRKRSGKSA